MANYGRVWRLRVNDLQFSGEGKPGELAVSFDIVKTAKREPNTATIQVYNLSKDHQKQLEALSVNKGQGRISCSLHAGFQGQLSQIFRGDLRRATTYRDGPELVTEISGEDGGRSIIWARVNKSFPPGTSVETVAKACAEAMGVGVGNIPEIIRGKRMGRAGNTYFDGCVLSGNAATELDHILRALGLRYSVQDGAIQATELGRPLQASAVLLSPSTGLVGRPSVNADGTVNVQALLAPDHYPHRRVKVESENVNGLYWINKVQLLGDTSGQNWYSNMELKA